MKVTPVAQATGQPGQALGGIEIGRTANPMKLERARAIARGEILPDENHAPPAEEPKPSVRTIKMHTQRSTDRLEANPQAPLQQEEQVTEPVEQAPEPQNEAPEGESIILESSEQAPAEVTQPLSPQLAAIAKAKRALQLERAAFDNEKKEIEALRQAKTAQEELLNRLKSSPLSVLQEHGVTYDQLTEAILSGQDTYDPKYQELSKKLQAIEDGFKKELTERDVQARKSALSEMSREAERLAKDGDTYELVRETGSIPKVIELIEKTYDEKGEILDVSEAMQLIEDELLKENLRLAALKKVQGRLTPQPQAQALQSQQPKQMKTLTARDTAAPAQSRRARAIAAFTGTLKR